MRSEIELFLCERVYQAITDIEESRTTNKDLNRILDLMRENNLELKVNMLDKENLNRSSPDKVLRLVKINNRTVLIPSTKSIGIVIKNNLEIQPSFEDLNSLLKPKMIPQLAQKGVNRE